MDSHPEEIRAGLFKTALAYLGAKSVDLTEGFNAKIN
jgi:hypothetical protein